VNREMEAAHLLLTGAASTGEPGESKESESWADLFNPQAQKAYWSDLDRNLFAAGLDGWWLDASEPEGDPLKNDRTHSWGRERPSATHTRCLKLRRCMRGRRAARPEQACRDPVALRVYRAAAQRLHLLVGRRLGQLGDITPADPGRPQFRNLRLSLLDDGHRRLLPS
jgi:alpha-glucosidase (family GH31 glycosyl hydrolase)